MSEAQAADETPCRRVGRPLPTDEHRRCPYCFGDEEAVRRGEHASFCEFRPGEDPVSFGFPQDHGRYRSP